MYTQSITRKHRTAFVMIIDMSGSMAAKIQYRGEQLAMADAVADIANMLIFDVIERARRVDEIRDYYDIGVFGYSGDGVVPLIDENRSLLSVSDLAARPVKMLRQTVEEEGADGRKVLRRYSTPQWVRPHASGGTPMLESFDYVHELLAQWCADPNNADSYPPIVFNITDGEASDCCEDELRQMCDKIKGLKTSDGNVLIVNIHITSSGERPMIYPNESEVINHRYAQLLFECSSVLPESMNEIIYEMKGRAAQPPFRGVSYNAAVTDLLTLLNIGSISLQIE